MSASSAGEKKGAISGEQRKRLVAAYDQLQKILQNKKCLDFLGCYDKVKTLLKNTRISFADDLGQVRFGDGHKMIAQNKGAIGAVTDGKTIRLNGYGSFIAVNRQVPAQIGGMATLAAPEICQQAFIDPFTGVYF